MCLRDVEATSGAAIEPQHRHQPQREEPGWPDEMDFWERRERRNSYEKSVSAELDSMRSGGASYDMPTAAQARRSEGRDDGLTILTEAGSN